jgi:hypothetical protein
MKYLDTSKLNHLKNDKDIIKIIKAVFTGYKAANKRINEDKSLDVVHGNEVRPHLQRAYIETELNLLQKKFPDTFKCSPKKNKSKNSTHTEVEFSRYILTQNKIEKNSISPRDAFFRDQLSYFNAPLFANMQDLPDKIYLILTHHGNEKPENISILIPSNGRVYEVIKPEFNFDMEEEIKTITPIENTDNEIPLGLKDFDINKAVNNEK